MGHGPVEIDVAVTVGIATAVDTLFGCRRGPLEKTMSLMWHFKIVLHTAFSVVPLLTSLVSGRSPREL